MKYLISLFILLCAGALAFVTGLEIIAYKFIFFLCIMVAFYMLIPPSCRHAMSRSKLSTMQKNQLDILKWVLIMFMVASIIAMFAVEYYDPSLLRKVASVILIVMSALIVLGFLIYTSVEKMHQEESLANDLIDSLTSSQPILSQQCQAMKESSNPCDAEAIHAVMEQFNNLIEKIPGCENNPRKFKDEFISLIRLSKLSDTNTFIYDTVNSQYSGAVDRLKNKCDLSQSEAEILCMTSVGFSNSAMVIALDYTSTKTVYNYKSSLKSKLGIAITQDSVVKYLRLYNSMSECK